MHVLFTLTERGDRESSEAHEILKTMCDFEFNRSREH